MACLGFLLFFLLLFLLASTAAQGEYGVVHVVSDNWSKDYCTLFLKGVKELACGTVCT